MPKYAVVMEAMVSTVVQVEADSEEEAIDAAEIEGVPSLMFVNHTYPDEGDWFGAAAYCLDEEGE